MGRLDSTYARLPLWAQHAAVSTYGLYWHFLRFGPGFSRFVREYQQRDHYSASDWSKWQAERLKTILSIAATHVPYYRRVWTPAQKAEALKGQLESLPLLAKDPLRREPFAFVRDDRKRPPLAFPTSGSTGTPILSLWTTRELRDSVAVREVRSAGWAGVSLREPRATFSGRMVEPDPHSAGPFYRFNAVERQVYLSPFHLRPNTAAQYVRALQRHRIRWLTGYAVSYYVLAQFILDQRLEPPPLDAVVTTSEKVTAPMREVMQLAYGCRVWEEYSTVENALFASECEAGSLHSSPDVAVVEILRPDGTPCDPGETGEVVATCLMHEHQLLIRFRVGDLATWSDCPCPCGRAMPVLREVVGRVEDVVIGPDGRRLVRFHGVFLSGVRVIQGQIVQEATDRIRIKVLPDSGYDDSDTAELRRRVQARLGLNVNVTVDLVDRIPTSSSGKAPAVVSLLRNNGERQCTFSS